MLMYLVLVCLGYYLHQSSLGLKEIALKNTNEILIIFKSITSGYQSLPAG